MRAALTALTDELKRLKASGVKTVSVSEETLVRLRSVVAARAAQRTEDKGQKADVRYQTSDVRRQVLEVGSRSAENVIEIAEVKTRAVEPVGRPAATTTPTTATPGAAPAFPPAPVVTLPAGDKKTRWDALYELVRNDPVCRAHVRPGKKVVLGVGSLDAKIFFCGEAPGAEEEEQGEPFVGPAGQLLTRMIQGMGLSRSDVYIGNIMNWRPELPIAAGGVQYGNRPPTQDEMIYCLPYLRAQLDVVKPELIVALGSTAAQGLLGFGSFKTLGEIRGQWKQFSGIPVMVTYHPSYILRNPVNRSKRAIWEDLLKAMERIGLPISEKQRAYFLDK